MKNLGTIRTDVVGSLLRPRYLKEARARFEEGTMEERQFREIEDRAVLNAVALQEAVGLDVITDGEMRRLNFQDSFGLAVEGYDAVQSKQTALEERSKGSEPHRRFDVDHDKKGTPVTHRRPVLSRLRLSRNIPREEFTFLKTVAKTPAKVTLIGADRISQRFNHEASRSVYASQEEFLQDVVAIERQMIGELVAAGCPYVHIDAPGFTAYVDQASLTQMRGRGEDPMVNLSRSIKAESDIIADFGGVTFGIHICRGNQRSTWHREGHYDAIAEQLFTGLTHDRFLLEYDTARAGGFAPLRFVPKGKIVVLGLISTKTPELETVDELKRRIDDASHFIPLEQLAISPQCGFSSDVAGNLVTPDDQKRKLERVVETARQVWG
jgi:5-methyltetrahydropteroyltriglutamate--homocysteine methyltransferase